MNLDEIYNKRYSVRKYSDKRIEKDILEKILDAGRIAPTATNAQPQKFYILESDEALSKLDEVTKMRYNANTVILVCCDMNKVWHSRYEEGYTTSDMDISIATTYMMLKATELGLGTVWVRAFDSNEVKEKFGLDENIKPICMLPIGYIADDSKPNQVMHFTRNELKDEVTYL